MQLSNDVLEFIHLLNKNEVSFLIVGGWAVGYHGIPRYTRDIDIFISKEKSNAERILLSLKEFGFASLDISITDLTRNEQVIQLGNEPNRIDLLTFISGVKFEDAWQNKILVERDGVKIPFISQKDLIHNKKASGRPQDIADVAALEKIMNEK